MNSLIFCGLYSLGNYTRDLAIYIAALMKPLWFELKLYTFSSLDNGLISLSLTLFNGILEVAVFLSQILRCLAASFASFFFNFSASRVINTYSSLGGLNGETASLPYAPNKASTS